jgi:hypothetical protein
MRSQTIHAQDITAASLLPRVVTPMTSPPAPPRVPRRSQNRSPLDFFQDEFCGMDTAHMAISLGNRHWYHQHQANEIIHPITGKEIEYMALMKDPRLQPLWERVFGRSLSPLLTQSLIQSKESSNVTSSQRWTSDHLARPDRRRHQQAFETDAGYCHGSHEPAAPEHTINLEGTS